MESGPHQIPTLEMSWKTRDSADWVFSEEIDQDESLLFHGTSSAREAAIDREGLRPGRSLISREAAASIVNAANLLGLAHAPCVSLGVLQTYTVGYDFRHGDLSPVFLHECADNALRYARSSVNGGEKAEAFLKTQEYLERVIADPKLHQRERLDKHERSLEALTKLQRDQIVQALAPDIPGWQAIVDRIRVERSLATYAVVYAIRGNPELLKKAKRCPTMGVDWMETIPPSAFAAKLRLYP